MRVYIHYGTCVNSKIGEEICRAQCVVVVVFFVVYCSVRCKDFEYK